MNDVTIHGVTKVVGFRHDYEGSPLKLIIKTNRSDYKTEVNLFFGDGNDALVSQLVDAIKAVSDPAVQVQEVAA